MTKELEPSALLDIQGTGELLITRLQLDALYDVGIRSYQQLFDYLLSRYPGFEFSMQEDFETMGQKLKWRKL